MLNVNLKALIDRLNPTCREALEAAAGLCLSRTHFNVELEHWLLKLAESEGSEFNLLLAELDINRGQLVNDLQRELDRFKTGNSRAPALAPQVVDLAQNAYLMASVEWRAAAVSSGHILAALLSDATLRRALSTRALGELSADAARDGLSRIAGTSRETAATAATAADSQSSAAAATASPALDRYTVDLTAAARAGKIDAVVGRDTEIRQIIDILLRRRQNNPILTGEAGVGKTAVVEGFALRVAAGDVPAALAEVAVRSLDLGLLQAGASIKGEFENRLKAVIAEVNASPKPIILFIDEAHTLVGAGGREGQGDAANLLKPALARGELRTIAATTWSEYKQYFEKDPALTRRFQLVKVEEPGITAAIDMMRALSGKLAEHHKVRILDEAVVASVTLAARYLTGRQLPDKCVSVLDTACARVSLSLTAPPARLDDVARRLTQTSLNRDGLAAEHATLGNCAKELARLEDEISALEAERAALTQQWQQERELAQKIEQLRTQLAADDSAATQTELHATLQELKQVQGETPLLSVQVDESAVAEVVGTWTGVPVGKMLRGELQKILALPLELRGRVIGQDHALAAISERIRTARAGLQDPRKPEGVFLLVGPSGVGKTETALALAELLYGGEHNLTVINMSEFKEEHKISMLLGAPPGYVGFGQGGVLTEAVRRKPYSVVLLDEIEKAHPGVQDIFYNLFDKGTIKDGEGRDIDFKNTVIIMTSNAAEAELRAMVAASEIRPEPAVLLDNLRPHLLRHFKPAFLGRAALVPYFPLSDEDLASIAQLNLRKIERRLATQYGATFSYSEEVLLHIVARSQEVDTGARNIEQILSQTLLPALAGECLGLLAEGRSPTSVQVGVDESGEFTYSVS